MLESEAKKKYCPFLNGEVIHFCLGSECMMWKERFKTSDHPEDRGHCNINLLNEND
jgi:hypothetical protein